MPCSGRANYAAHRRFCHAELLDMTGQYVVKAETDITAEGEDI